VAKLAEEARIFLSRWYVEPGFNRIQSPVFRPLEQRLWDVGRGETPHTCVLARNDMASPRCQSLLVAMLEYEPAGRLRTNGAINSELVLDRAHPALE
jgi:serine/threonine-protein kinase SRPK3